MTQPKIADKSKTHQKLVPICILGVPECVRGVRQKNSHMGRRITHNEIVRIWGLTYIKWRLTEEAGRWMADSAILVPGSNPHRDTILFC